MNEYPYWLPNDRFVQYQALRGQEADLRKRAEAMLESADKLGELATSILLEFDPPE
jgi:hypothetical protein